MLTFYFSLIEDHQYDSKFERIYYKYEKLMFATVLEVTKDFYDAEEALNDAFIVVAKKIAIINEENEKSLKSLLCIIAKNAAKDCLRRKKRKDKIVNIESLSSTADLDVYTAIEDNEEYLILVDKIKKMDSIYTDVLMLHLVLSLSTGQIAHILNINANTVSSHIRRGKILLRKYLIENEVKK